MITEDYVSFEIAKLLKEKGFNEPCLYYYFSDGVKMYKRQGLRHRNSPSVNTYSAPTHQMATKWLREVHKIDIWVEGWNRRYKGNIHSEQRGEEALFYEDSYEVACETVLKYCLENLI